MDEARSTGGVVPPIVYRDIKMSYRRRSKDITTPVAKLAALVVVFWCSFLHCHSTRLPGA
jgi:hypothetical protein